MTDKLLKWREEFPILARSTYLISNSLGAMPRGVYDSLAGYADSWATRGVRAWESASGRRDNDGWWTLPADIGDLIAPLLGAGPGQVVTQLNVTLATAMALSCFDFRPPRNRIVLTELEFPSVRYLYDAQRGRGAEIFVVPSDDGIRVETGRLLEAIDERTLVVGISHVLFRSAYIQDAAAITRRAQQVGAHVILDTYHSTGVLPYSVKELGVDFAVGGVLKWLCGGPGVAFLYVRPDLRARLTPTLAGWQAHRRPFAFEPQMDLRDDAWRFLTGTPQIPALYAARPGLEIINQVGVENIRAKSVRQTSRLVELARERGWRLPTPLDSAQRGGTVTIDVPGAERVCHQLLERSFLVDYRPNAGIRIAPHFYTSDQEIHAVVKELSDSLIR
jgi:kynureninase